jgi:hypothetical protein
MRGEKKEVESRTRWWQLRQGPSLSCGGIDGQMSRVWRADQRHDPFNSAGANPARASCDAWVVASAHSAGSVRHDFLQKIIYTCTIYIQYYKYLSMMFYWLDSFVWCLSSIRVWVQTPPLALLFNDIPHLLHRFLIFYTELIWKKCRDFFVKKMA